MKHLVVGGKNIASLTDKTTYMQGISKIVVTISSYKKVLQALQMKTILKRSRYWGWKISYISPTKYIVEKGDGSLQIHKYMNKNYKMRQL